MLKIEGDIPYLCSRNSYAANAARKAFWVKNNTKTNRVDTAFFIYGKNETLKKNLDLMFCKALHVYISDLKYCVISVHRNNDFPVQLKQLVDILQFYPLIKMRSQTINLRSPLWKHKQDICVE